MPWQDKTPRSSSSAVRSHKEKLGIRRHFSFGGGGGGVRMKTLSLSLSFKLRVRQILHVVLTNTGKYSALFRWDSNEMGTVFHAITLHGMLWHSNQALKLIKTKKESIFAKKKKRKILFLFVFYVNRGNGRAALCKLVKLLFWEEKDKIIVNESHTHCNNFLGFFFLWFCLMYFKTIFAKWFCIT